MMTDTTHEKPERIWAGNWLADVGETAVWDMGEWRNEPWSTVDVVEYVRAARIEELEADLAKAVEALGNISNIGVAWSRRYEDQIKEAQEVARTTLAELKGGEA